MLYRTLIAFTTVAALGSVPLATGAFAAGHAGGHASAGHAAAGHAMGGRAHVAGARGYAGGRGYGRSYGGGYGGGYGCNSYYYDYNGCGYNPGAAVVGGLIGGALNGVGVY